MTPDRFAALALAYGSDLERWPDADREAAVLYLAATPAAAEILNRERDLDAALAGSVALAPDADRQRHAITALYQQSTARAERRRWFSGFWMAGVLSSGVAAGVAAMALVYLQPTLTPTDERVGGLYEQSSFGDLTSFDEAGAAKKGN
jgi:hypothetical protein